MPTRFTTLLLPILVLIAGCVTDAAPYDADWGESPFADGKADELLDIVPALAFDASATGVVGGHGFDLYKIELLGTDRIELTMTVTDGDLNPHLSFYRGTSTYVSSESWRRDGAALIKTHLAEDAGTFLIAVRAYRGEGNGAYRLTARCVGGACAGELPPSGSEFEIAQVANCISQARRCAFERMARYNGAVGPVRSTLLMQECLDAAALEDGSSCSSACAWINPEDERDTADEVCNAVIESLPFYADQTTACLDVFDECMSNCYRSGRDHSWDYALHDTVEVFCFSEGLNGSCNQFARRHASCGGDILSESAGECEEHCRATSGAFTDDIQGICGEDAGCDDYCGVDITAAGERCGGYAAENESCIVRHLEDTQAGICVDRVSNEL